LMGYERTIWRVSKKKKREGEAVSKGKEDRGGKEERP